LNFTENEELKLKRGAYNSNFPLDGSVSIGYISLCGDMSILLNVKRVGAGMKQFIRVMKAMSDPNRVRILKLLEEKELCVCELTELLGLAQSTVSKHLKLMDDAELVESRRDGAWIIYRINVGEKSSYAEIMLDSIRGWHDDDELLREMHKRLPFVDRQRIMVN
jgi:ArsR family transcriptional regulator